jgi:hypothetical protein
MAAVEIFTNQPTTSVSSGGTDAPVSGTTEAWTVASSALFPPASSGGNPPTQFHVSDTASNYSSEIILVTNVSGNTWSVTRGAEGSTPVAHVAGFSVQQVVTAGFLADIVTLLGATLQGWLAPAVVTLTDAATVAVNAALGNDYRLLFTTGVGASRIIGTPTNPVNGQSVSLDFQQPSSGGPCSVTWSTAWDFGASGTPTLSTAGSAVDVVGFRYHGGLSKWLCLGWKLGF